MRLHRMSMIAAGGVGYVLGAKAGRGRYEQIRHAVKEAPHATAEAREKVEHAREKVMAAADKVRHHGDDTAPDMELDGDAAEELPGVEFVEERPGDFDPRF